MRFPFTRIMARRRRDCKHGRAESELAVYLKDVRAPDAQDRLARAYDLVLRAAARAEVDEPCSASDGADEPSQGHPKPEEERQQ